MGGTHMNSSIYKEAVELRRQMSADGHCPVAGATNEQRLQGFPVSQFAKLARQSNLFYTAIVDCALANCSGREMGEVWDRGWCSRDAKTKQFVDIDVSRQLIPVIWILYDACMRLRATPP